MNSNRNWLWIALIAALAAVGVHGYLTMHHYELLLGISEGNSVCNLGGAFDCDAVNTSSYSEFGGKAVALWGAAANLLLALLIFWHAILGVERQIRYAFYLALAIAGVSVVMGTISYTQIRVFCLFCATVYALSFVSVLGLFLYTGKGRFSHIGEDFLALLKSGSEGARSTLVTGIVVGIAPVFVVHSMVMGSYGKRLEWAIPEALDVWSNGESHTFSDEGALTKGATADKAVLTLVEFADFRCPHCKRAVTPIHSFVKARPDVRLIFMNFPLDGGCNPAVESQGASCGLAKATYCSNRQQKGWQAHDWLFENQGRVDSANLGGLIAEIGLNEAEFKSCMESSETHDAILSQATKGRDSGVRGTPTIYANGKNLPDGFLIPILEAVYKKVKK